MAYPFLETFFQVLISKSHDLLKEEIIGTMYSMASEDFDTFYMQILPRLLDTVEISVQQRGLLTADVRLDRVGLHFIFLFAFFVFFSLSFRF